MMTSWVRNSAAVRSDEKLLKRIISLISEDKDSLCKLCFVSKLFNALASQALYAKVSVSSTSDIGLDGREDDNKSYSAFISSCLSRNSALVQEFEVVGQIISTSSESSSTIQLALESAFFKYTNLISLVWQPSFCDTDLALAIFRILPSLPTLKRLSVKVPFLLPPPPPPASQVSHALKPAADSDLDAIPEEEEDAQSESDVDSYQYKPLSVHSEDDFGVGSLTLNTPPFPPRELVQLQHLTLTNPSPNFLVSLPESLMSLNSPLLSLIFEDDCGSVTPGVLTSLLPVTQALENFGLGVAYSVKYDELFPFLSELKNLKYLELFHYPQLDDVPSFLHLHSLLSLKITHAYTCSRKHILNMCKWVHRLIHHSPLERLEIICDDAEDFLPGPNISYDGLVTHLVCRHTTTLRILKMGYAFIGAGMVRMLMESCNALEEMEGCVRVESFNSLDKLLPAAPNLRSVALTVVNAKKKLFPDQGLLQDGKTPLRRVVVNKRGFEGEWITEWKEGQRLQTVFRVSQIEAT
ncbi:hypothetical protein DFH11DRAFT_1854889 [Phellopilus nigrolimitatus]|nr:hypothetical protein DFH11DRAFT_1854889 [Phellopilus nigrolimitatus]